MAKQGGTSDDIATDDEIEAAIRALAPAELLRLRRVASYRARALAAHGLGFSGSDLLQEAIARTFAGKRRWRKAVAFVTYLLGAMRSIANHALERLHGATVVPTEEDGVELPIAAQVADPERAAAAHQRLEQIRSRFDGDTEVALVLDCLADGMTGIDIQRDLGLTAQQYETIIVRLRRGIDRTEGWAP
jgi:DNA-directed RNA polymerase specialized sigma24 family protein